jgi:putative DNA methylase
MITTVKVPKKLIEVALPLDAINEAAAREKSIRQGHPSSLHLWWARRPLAAARAVIFAQMVNDPSWKWELEHPGEIPPNNIKASWAASRNRLFAIIKDLVKWENTTNEGVLHKARAEIRKSWRETCDLNKDHPQAAELFDPERLPAFHDPFAGGGALPLEAQRLGLESYASDLNPIAVLINKAMIELPPKFADRPPVNPEARSGSDLVGRQWKGAQGLAEDVRFYGQWMYDRARERVGHLYPPVEITGEMVKERPDLKPLLGQKLTVLAWIWARTVKSPSPAFSHIDVPLASTFMLAAKTGAQAYIEPITEGAAYKFIVRVGSPRDLNETKLGTRIGSGSGFRCLLSGAPISFDYVRSEALGGRMGQTLLAIVAEHKGKKVYLSSNDAQFAAFDSVPETRGPDGTIPDQALGIRVQLYGIQEYANLFNKRQREFLSCLTELVPEVGRKILTEPDVEAAYSQAIETYLALCIGRYADYGSTMTFWDDRGPSIQKSFGLPTLQMRWSYPETNPFGSFSGNMQGFLEGAVKAIEPLPSKPSGWAKQEDATSPKSLQNVMISTDPPYYDNIGYAALSDYFYVWLRLALRATYPDLFATIVTPKDAELIAEPGRHGSKAAAASFFEDRFSRFATLLGDYAHPAFPVTIYYAFKQAELENQSGDLASTGWELFLSGLVQKGWAIHGTWPMRTEQPGGLRLAGRNSLASSIVLVCHKRPNNAETISRRAFQRELNQVLPEALDEMTRGSGDDRSPVAPVDLSQAIIGPGMAVFSKYQGVLEADGTPMSVRTALQLINRFLAEDDFDQDTQFCLHWFEQYGWKEGRFGEADTLARAKGTSVDGVKQSGVLTATAGIVRLLKWGEYPSDWNPVGDERLPVWEALHHLIRILKMDGESGAGSVLASVAAKAEPTRQLAYRLYTLCERAGWAEDARAYNEIITSWSAIEAAAAAAPKSIQSDLFG